jgi:hypothetical protein
MRFELVTDGILRVQQRWISNKFILINLLEIHNSPKAYKNNYMQPDRQSSVEPNTDAMTCIRSVTQSHFPARSGYSKRFTNSSVP